MDRTDKGILRYLLNDRILMDALSSDHELMVDWVKLERLWGQVLFGESPEEQDGGENPLDLFD